MSDNTPRLQLPELVAGQAQMSVTHNEALAQIDALADLYLKGQFVNTPPSAPSDGDAWLVGGAPTGAWSGYAYKIASCLDGGWRFYTPFDGLRAFVTTTGRFILYQGGAWSDCDALIGGAEVSIASAATCDLGAAGALCVAVTGTSTITSFGAGANILRLVRFAGAMTLTHNAVSLILKSGASRTTAAGDTAAYLSDASGNWRELYYQRAGIAAAAADICAAGPTGTVLGASGLGIGMSPVHALLSVTNTGANGNWARLGFLSAAGESTGAYPSIGYNMVGDGAGGWKYDIADTASFIKFDTGATKFYCAPSGAAGSTLTPALAGMFGTDGSFLLGTATNGGWNGNARLEALQTSGYALSGHKTSSASGGALLLRVDDVGTNLTAFCYASSVVGTITTSGTGTNYNTTSDARLKTVLPEQRDYRAAIAALWVGDFLWTENGAAGFGVLAQQAHAVMPNGQGVTKPATEDGVWQAAAEPFAHLALWGVKDLYAMIAALEARVAALEAR